MLGHGVNAGSKVVDLNDTACTCLNGFVHAVARNGKGNALDLAVLGSLDDLGAAVADLDVQIAFHGVADRSTVSDHILHCSVGAVMAVTPHHNAFANIGFGSRDYQGLCRCRFGGDRQCITTGRKIDSGLL